MSPVAVTEGLLDLQDELGTTDRERDDRECAATHEVDCAGDIIVIVGRHEEWHVGHRRCQCVE